MEKTKAEVTFREIFWYIQYKAGKNIHTEQNSNNTIIPNSPQGFHVAPDCFFSINSITVEQWTLITPSRIHIVFSSSSILPIYYSKIPPTIHKSASNSAHSGTTTHVRQLFYITCGQGRCELLASQGIQKHIHNSGYQIMPVPSKNRLCELLL